MNEIVRILYVDDYPLDRELVRDALEKEHGGFELVEAASRADFETTLAQGGFDLVLSDFNILGFEGLQVLETVRASGSNLPVIIVTGTGSEEVAAEAIKRGAADYVIKSPNHIQRLPHTIHAVLEKKWMDEALQASEARYRLLHESMMDCFAQVNMSGEFVDVNPSYLKMLGYSKEEVFKLHYFDITPQRWHRLEQDIIDTQILPFGYSDVYEKEYIKKDGTVFPIELRTFLLRDAEGQPSGMWAIVRDITERKRAEEGLRESEDKFKYVFDHSVAGISLTLLSGELNVNQAFCEMVGYSADELNHRKWQEITHPEDVELTLNANRALLSSEKESMRFTKRYIHKNGSIVWADVATALRRDKDSQPLYFMSTFLDITERVRAEEEIRQLNATLEQRVKERTRELHEAQEQLVRQEKLAVLGQLAGGVGHELRNPLGVISSAVYYLKLVQPDAKDKIRQYHDMIEQEVHKAAQIIGDLLDFARVITAERQPVSIPELVQRTLSRFPVSPSVKVRIKIPADLPLVYADPRLMEQVFNNLITNAFQAMVSQKSTGTMSKRTGSTTGVNNKGKLTISAQREKKLVAIAVKDTGTGISPENMKKLFEPLFSTKLNGIGLGLAVSKKLAEADGGRIEVKSELGKGSTFTVYLPAQDE